MDAGFAGHWVNADGNLLIIRTTRRGRFRARFIRKDGRVSLRQRFLARLFERPAFGLYGAVRDGALEIEIGPGMHGRALRLRFARDEDGDLLLPEIAPSIVDLDDWCRAQAPRVPWLEPLSRFRRAT
jgi:hypothetical protein